jgi:hypothetical protein
MRKNYDPYNGDKTCSIKTFKEHEGGVCEDFCSYMHYTFPKSKHTIYGYICNTDCSKWGYEKPVYSGHVFILYDNRIHVELAWPKEAGIHEYKNEKEALNTIKLKLHEHNKLMTMYKSCPSIWKLVEWKPDNKEVFHVEFIEGLLKLPAYKY